MQVHYNLLGGAGPDRAPATLLRLGRPATRDLTPLQTMLLPAPVELPCRAAPDDADCATGRRPIADVIHRFGPVGNTNNLLLPALRRTARSRHRSPRAPARSPSR